MSHSNISSRLIHGRIALPLRILWYLLMLLPALLYLLLILLRNFLYTAGLAKVHAAAIPVISIGNLTVGGTGKTPLVMLAAEHFASQGIKTAVIARGYGNDAAEDNDELTLIKLRLPDIITISSPDRVSGARQACEQGAQLIILDDGFQHRRLARDCNILTIDQATAGFPHLLLPAGPFRELWYSRKRADIHVYTKCSTPAAESKQQQFYTSHQPTECVWGANSKELIYLKEKPVFLLSAIADPEAFRNTAAGLSPDIRGENAYPDHYIYSADDIRQIRGKAAATGAETILTTEKDMVKLIPLLASQQIKSENNIEFLALSVRISFFANEPDFWEIIHQKIPL